MQFPICTHTFSFFEEPGTFSFGEIVNSSGNFGSSFVELETYKYIYVTFRHLTYLLAVL